MDHCGVLYIHTLPPLLDFDRVRVYSSLICVALSVFRDMFLACCLAAGFLLAVVLVYPLVGRLDKRCCASHCRQRSQQS